MASAASLAKMETGCKAIARSMMEEPSTFKYIDARPATKDQNKGVAIRFTGSKDNLQAVLSCFYVGDEISKLHLKMTEKNGDEIDEYLADFLVEQAKKDLKAKQ